MVGTRPGTVSFLPVEPEESLSNTLFKSQVPALELGSRAQPASGGGGGRGETTVKVMKAPLLLSREVLSSCIG